MPLVLTATDLETYLIADRRVRAAAPPIRQAVTTVRTLFPVNGWTGMAAQAAATCAQRLVSRLEATSQLADDAARRTAAASQALAAELAHRHALERLALDNLGRLATLPGDVRADAHAAVGRLLGVIPPPWPPSGSELWEGVSRLVTRWLP